MTNILILVVVIVTTFQPLYSPEIQNILVEDALVKGLSTKDILALFCF